LDGKGGCRTPSVFDSRVASEPLRRDWYRLDETHRHDRDLLLALHLPERHDQRVDGLLEVVLINVGTPVLKWKQSGSNQ
jgi:hypothetical protein